MADKHVLPQENEQQRIGHMAEMTLNARQPMTWRTKSLAGTDDVGLDVQVQIVGPSGVAGISHYKDVFRIQLKGTESPTRSADGSYFSVNLTGATVRYYDRMTEPLLLVLCDLSVCPEDPRACPAYYLWIHDEIKRRRRDSAAAVDTNKTLTVRIPSTNVLTATFDASPEVERVRQLMQVAVQLDQAVETTSPSMRPEERTAYAEKIVTGLTGRSPALLDAVSRPVRSLWPTAPSGSVPAKLKEVSSRLKVGDSPGARALLETMRAEIGNGVALEQAEWHHLQGLLLSQESNEQGAIPFYERAYALADLPTYLTSWIEARFRQEMLTEDKADFATLLELLVGDEPDVVALRARIMATQGRNAEADALLDSLQPTEATTTKAIVALIRGDWDRLIHICTMGLARLDSPQNEQGLLFMLRARGRFHKAMRIADADSYEWLPITGPKDLDVELLLECWADIERTIQLFSDAGWPENTRALADVWAATATILGMGKDTLPIMKVAATARPQMRDLQAALETVAAHCDDYDTALAANARVCDGPDESLRRVALLYRAKKYRVCIDTLNASLPTIPKEHPHYPMALSIGISAEDRMFRPDRAAVFEEMLRECHDGSEYLASLAYTRSTKSRGLATDRVISDLGQAFAEHPTSLGLGLQYMMAINVEKQDDAREVIATAEKISHLAQLPSEAALHLAQAYVTLGNWADLLALGQNAARRFPTQVRFRAVQAVALDKLGRSAEARRILHEVVNNGLDDSLAVHTYVRIAVRSGFVEDATALAEQLVANEGDRKTRLGYLKLLHELQNSQAPGSARAEQIAWEIGSLVEQESEAEEGAFLVLYWMATLSRELEADKREIFQQRLATFVRRFPNSRILSQHSMPEDPTWSDIEEMLLKIDPDFKERHEHKAKLEAMLERGALPVPFAWRPSLVLQNIPDVPSLWRYGISSMATPTKAHLQMVQSDWEAPKHLAVAGRVPILDLPALLVINELGLFGVLFSTFAKVAVSQAVLDELRKAVAPMASGWGRTQCVQIAGALKEHFDNVLSPTTPVTENDEDCAEPKFISDEIKALVGSGEYMLYSDDAIFRIYADVPAAYHPIFCTLDLLVLADEKGLLSVSEAGRALSKLCKWNVGVVIPDRYLFACIPNGIMRATNVSDSIGILMEDEYSGPMFTAIWDIRRPYKELNIAGARLAARWLEEAGHRIETVAALIGVWYLKAKLHGDLKGPPLQQLTSMLVLASTFSKVNTDQISRRFWHVFVNLIPFEYGARMDQKCEREAYELMGMTVARIEFQLALKGENDSSISKFFRSGLTDETASQEWYSAAYNAEWQRLLIDAEIKKHATDRVNATL